MHPALEYTHPFSGIISAESQKELEQLTCACATARVVRLDFAAVIRINSMGVALLLKALKQLKQAGKTIHITGANPMTRTLFRMMGITHWAVIH
jgi:anti-anti-sigma factor